MLRSGHRSLAVHGYKRPSLEQEMSISKVLDVPEVASVAGCNNVKRHCTNSENILHENDDKRDSMVRVDRVSAQPSLSLRVTRIMLPENVDTIVISKNGREITVTIA